MQKMVSAAVARIGRLDMFINNVAVRAEQPLEDMSLRDWQGHVSRGLAGGHVRSTPGL